MKLKSLIISLIAAISISSATAQEWLKVTDNTSTYSIQLNRPQFASATLCRGWALQLLGKRN